MFELVDRGKKRYIVLICGWAFDHRVFATLDLPYNYIYFNGEPSADFSERLSEILNSNNIAKISLLGWSQGAFMACDFAASNPQIAGEVILIGTRKRYEREGLDEIKKYLRKNRTAYLYQFYKNCFCSEQKDHYQWFRETLLKRYLDKMSLERLIKGLNWLATTEINMESLKKIKRIKIIHGKNDAIAPVEEALELSAGIPQSQCILFDNTGHVPFLNKDFRRCFYED